MRIYIAGKITGLSETEYRERFMRAQQLIAEKGHKPVNPIYLTVYELGYEDYMTIDQILIDSCDAIYLLSNWQDSPGARREKAYAEYKGKVILYETANQIPR